MRLLGLIGMMSLALGNNIQQGSLENIKETRKGGQRSGFKDHPYFQGFDGVKYDFQGKAGYVFNIITDTNYQLNAEFVKFVESPTDHLTVMGKLGFRIRNDNVTVTPRSVEINGRPVTSFGQYHLTEGFVVVNSYTSVEVVSPGFEVIVTKDSATSAYLNIGTIAKADGIHRPHGLLGQTAKSLASGGELYPNDEHEGVLVGAPANYIVDDGILGTNFAFNCYQPSSQASELGSSSRLHETRRDVPEAPDERRLTSPNWHLATGDDLYIENDVDPATGAPK